MLVNSINCSYILLAPLVLTALSTQVNAQTPYQPGVGFAIVGLASGQSLRVNALNLGTGSSAPESRCTVTLQFLDANGQALKQTVATLRPGKAAFLDLGRDEVAGDDARAPIRAVLLFGYYGGAQPGPGTLQMFDCNIVPSLEIFDSETKQTSAVLTDAKTLPPPATPAQ